MNRSSVSLLLLCLAMVALPASAQVPNDTCATAITLVAGANGPFSNVGADTTIAACVTSNSDVFFQYTPVCPGSMTVTTCGSALDTVLAVYSACPPGAYITCNDDFCGLQSSITFVAAAGTTYYFRVASWSTTVTGSFPVNLTPPPSCSSLLGAGAASPASLPAGAATLLTVAVTSNAPPTPPTGVSVSIDLTSIGLGPQVMFDDGSNGDLVPYDNVFSLSPTIPGVTPNGVYTFPWTATDSVPRTVSGLITVNVSPINDGCATPIALSPGANGPFTNAGATDSGVFSTCGVGGSVGSKDVWFSYTPACSGNIVVDTCASVPIFDTHLNAYAFCGGPEIACNDDANGTCGLGSSITFAGVAGSTYLIRASSYSTTLTGSFVITVSAGTGMTLSMTEPGGPGSGTLQIDFGGGPAFGLYFLAVTFNQGGFPGGWLYGVDIPLSELQTLISTGPPFLGPLSGCGSFTLGPFAGVGFLTGIPIYAVALGIPQPGPLAPSIASAPITFTII